MSLNDASSVKLSDLAFAKIAGRIRSGEYSMDARLPTENEFARMLGISRPIVREALARMRDAGIIVSRRGSGSYVQTVPEPQHEPRLTSIADMRRCFEYRISLEGEAAYHAALGAKQDRAALIAAMERLEADLQAKVMQADSDFGFHLAIAEATGNRFFHKGMLVLRTTIVTAMGLTPTFLDVRSRDRLASLHLEHVRVYDAIMADDPEASMKAMRDHLTSAMHRVFEGI
jgi:DNA-binding FadR family transcriptional regulator